MSPRYRMRLERKRANYQEDLDKYREEWEKLCARLAELERDPSPDARRLELMVVDRRGAVRSWVLWLEGEVEALGRKLACA